MFFINFFLEDGTAYDGSLFRPNVGTGSRIRVRVRRSRPTMKLSYLIWWKVFVILMLAVLPVTMINFTLKLTGPDEVVSTALPWLFALQSSSGQESFLRLHRLAVAAWDYLRPDCKSPSWLVQKAVPVLAWDEMLAARPVIAVKTMPSSEVSSEENKLANEGKIINNQERIDVFIYHTHTGEAYVLSEGVERLPGKEGGVVAVGRALATTLTERYGLKVYHCTRIHDEIYSQSYQRSAATVEEYVKAPHPPLVVLDIHRDAGRSRNDSLVNINGQQVAPILIIVGSDARAPFPTWRQNYEFATKLAESLNHLYPGLCLGVRVKEGRYNQHLHPRSLLLEIGSVNNTVAEAEAAVRLLADALAPLVRQLQEEGGKKG